MYLCSEWQKEQSTAVFSGRNVSLRRVLGKSIKSNLLLIGLWGFLNVRIICGVFVSTTHFLYICYVIVCTSQLAIGYSYNSSSAGKSGIKSFPEFTMRNLTRMA